MSRIASLHGVSRHTVITANRLERPDSLRIGQRLEVPGCRPLRALHTAGPPAARVQPDGTLFAQVGPRRVPTRLFLASPEFADAGIQFVWPVDGPVISNFGRRRSGWHAGMDIKAEVGAAVVAAAPGVVSFSGSARAYGRVIKIEHARGFTTIYAHNLENLVRIRDEVEAGDPIATVGRSGRTTGYHLHFEIRREGMAYNPLHLLGPREEPAAPPAGEVAAAAASEASAEGL